ncbi:MAG: hypothetical protein NVSMB32_15960 [Actinomycetota bacterium]
MTAQPGGIDAPAVIDMVALSANEDTIELIMMQTKPWDGSAALILKLQDKWQHYVGFAIHGGLERAYPDYAQLPWRVVLACTSEPDARIKEFVRRADEVTRKEGGEFVIRLQGPKR